MKKYMILGIFSLLALALNAQEKFFTKTGRIVFHSKAPLETIEAQNKAATCVLDAKTGNLQFALLMKGFEFEKALMQEHFNENYVESHKFPKAEFRGQLLNNQEVNYAKDGVYPVKVKGKLTIHGETRDVETTGKIEVKQGRIMADADFSIMLEDYKIEIPKIVKDNISKTVKITVDVNLDPLKG